LYLVVLCLACETEIGKQIRRKLMMEDGGNSANRTNADQKDIGCANDKDKSKIRVFRGAKLIDGTGASPLPGSVVVVEGSKILFVGKETEDYPHNNDPVETHDISGKVIMPGLIDAHVHLWGWGTQDYYHRVIVPDMLGAIRAAEDLRKMLAAGYTSVRCCGGNKSVHLKRAVHEGTLAGPRVKAAHLVVSQTAGHMDIHFLPLEDVKQKALQCRIADGPDECRKAAREQFREGADFIKICTTGGTMSQKDGPFEIQMTQEEIRAVVEEAERKNSYVAAHAQCSAGVIHAVQGGVKTVEHGKNLDRDSCQMMIDRDVILVSTLSIGHQLGTYGKDYGVRPWALEKAAAGKAASKKSLKMAYDMGVRIAMGTDYSGTPGLTPLGENSRELELMVDIGIKSMDAICSATQIAAEAIGMGKETGSLETGKIADLIVVEGNPLEDIRVLQDNKKIKMVVKDGKIIVQR
jgi:imidazolonepropionase-like amidohydrolase